MDADNHSMMRKSEVLWQSRYAGYVMIYGNKIIMRFYHENGKIILMRLSDMTRRYEAPSWMHSMEKEISR